MKIIDIPADIQIRLKTQTGEDKLEPRKFVVWAEEIVDFYGEVKTLKQVRQVQKITDALKSANGTMQLEDADYDLFKAAVEAYPTKLPAFITKQHLPFIDALERAQEVKK
jgi:hypothetical protein